MKYLIASDLHGSAETVKKLWERYDAEKAERMLLLGDLLYHGPRNDLPDAYRPKEVIEMLNERREQIFCVRGNCDTEVDQMVLQFPILASYALMEWEGRTVMLTHGHVHHADALPPLQRGDVLLHGHTHVPVCEEKDGILILNPGSVTLPKGGSVRSYMTYENGLLSWKDLEGNTYQTYSLGGNK